MRGKFDIKWIDRGRPPMVPPNPDYPDGCHLDMTLTAQALQAMDGVERERLTTPAPKTDELSCLAQLPYPTGHKNIGTWNVKCLRCGLNVFVTAASRPDDPRSVRVACLRERRK